MITENTKPRHMQTIQQSNKAQWLFSSRDGTGDSLGEIEKYLLNKTLLRHTQKHFVMLFYTWVYREFVCTELCRKLDCALQSCVYHLPLVYHYKKFRDPRYIDIILAIGIG